MNPNTPPNDPRPESADTPPYSDQDPFAGHARGNPYYANAQDGTQPDLDANAPLLKSSELQRLNRKALLFLAGIIALLIMMTIWVVSRATSDDEVDKPNEEIVTIPELPRDTANGAEAAPPIEVTEYTPPDVGSMPPLPPEDTQSGYGDGGFSPEYAGPVAPRAPSLVERRMNNGDGSAEGMGGPDASLQGMLAGNPGMQPNLAGAAQGLSQSEASSAQFINNPDALLVRGTYLRCVLETRIITDVPGFTSCIVTEPIYSINGRRLLLPKGSKIYGAYKNTDPDMPRIAVVWDRITTPNGIDVAMSSPGVDQLGSAGYKGDYDAHWGSRITSALLISMLSDVFKYAGAEYGPTNTTISNGVITQSPYESNTAETVQNLARQALSRSARLPATVTINQGTIVNVYVAKDVDFTAVLARN